MDSRRSSTRAASAYRSAMVVSRKAARTLQDGRCLSPGAAQDALDCGLGIRCALYHGPDHMASLLGKVMAGSGHLLDEAVSLLDESVCTSYHAPDQTSRGEGTDFTNAVIDRAVFLKADLEGAIFKNTVLSGSTFEDANLKDVSFEDTLIGYIDLQKLCRNTSINEDTRLELGCR
nr:thylakoid lumenal 17.4 kDa protein, chloroplastic-like [Lolium perenne]